MVTGFCDPAFRRLLAPFSVDALDSLEETVFGIWPDGRLAFVNSGWIKFGEVNGAPERLLTNDCLGVSVLDATSAVLRSFYADLFAKSLAEDPHASPPLTHRYECSSPDLRREFVMSLYTLRDRGGIVVVNSLVTLQDIAGEGEDPTSRESSYTDAHGMVHQCAHCRRIRAQGGPERWDWIPTWVRDCPRQVSHTLCPVCLDLYYPRSGERDQAAPD